MDAIRRHWLTGVWDPEQGQKSAGLFGASPRKNARASSRQGKTDKPRVLPCTQTLRATLERAKAGLGYVPIASKPVPCGATGGRMTYRYMANEMLKVRRRLGLEAFDLHALRYRGIKELAWAGCTDDEIASYSGHATTTMIAKCAGEARQEMHARSARLKRQRTEHARDRNLIRKVIPENGRAR